MINNMFQALKIFIIFLPFVFFQFLNQRLNYKKEVRYKQFIMPFVSLIYFLLLSGFIGVFYKLSASLGGVIDNFMNEYGTSDFLNAIKSFFASMGGYIAIVFLSIVLLALHIFIKKTVLLFFKNDFDNDSSKASIVGILYEFDETDNRWYLKNSCGQMRTFIKTAYYVIYTLSAFTLFRSYELFSAGLLTFPFCPVLPVIVIGEITFLIDGLMKEEGKDTLVVSNDASRHIAMYALLRKPLKKLFGDKLSAEGTTINVVEQNGGAAEDILANIEESGGHIGENYAAFMRKKIDGGLSPHVDYLRSGYELAIGKSLLFNTPFYDKLIPYAFYAVNRCLLSGKKVLVVMGRHGTEDDLIKWCRKGMTSVTNVPDMYRTAVLYGQVSDDEDVADIGIISRSGVHNLDIHKANAKFLRKVGFVIIIEPSRLVTTAQIGLNLLIKCCGDDNEITFCSLDRNCDGLVDSLSHILMTNITEVSATEYPHGMSSFMCWKADDEYMQHRLFPGVSRYLGLGTELSFVALKNQVKHTVWYGGDAYPVIDAHWISKQYYYDFLKYANLSATQENFDRYFKASFNMCNESVSDYSYVTVEDDRNNLFETRRNFSTIAENQGFVNVISSEYMLREYMADNTDIFTADAKAIPYITADYARTKRNSVLTLCLRLCVGNVSEKELKRQLMLIGLDNSDCAAVLWNELCALLSTNENMDHDKNGAPVLVIDYTGQNKTIKFFKSTTLIFKREYSVESGKFENVYTIENKEFADIILDDLQNAGYIAELEGKDYYVGTELKGHVYQKYLPGQFLTLNGKYYEMISATADDKIMVRRASDHINGRISYRQVRRYILGKIRNSEDMGALKTINNIDIHYLCADFRVETDGYWKLKSYNDFENGSLVEINGVPKRKYFNKHILKLDFSKFGDSFTDDIRKTLTVLLNEIFVTLFAENQPFISAVTPGESSIPSTYSLSVDEENNAFNKCIFIIEDSQLDIGLLVAVERNLNRIMEIISDYLLWNKEKIENSKKPICKPVEVDDNSEDDRSENNDNETRDDINVEMPKKRNIFSGVVQWFKSLFKKKSENSGNEGESAEQASDEEIIAGDVEDSYIPQNDAGEEAGIDEDTEYSEQSDEESENEAQTEPEVVYSE